MWFGDYKSNWMTGLWLFFCLLHHFTDVISGVAYQIVRGSVWLAATMLTRPSGVRPSTPEPMTSAPRRVSQAQSQMIYMNRAAASEADDDSDDL